MNRVAQIQAELQPGEALLVTGAANRYYLTSFRSSAGSVWITRDKAVFLIDFRYYEKAKSTVTSCEVMLTKKTVDEITKLCHDFQIKTLYLETGQITLQAYTQWEQKLTGITISTDDKMDRLLEQMRSVKSSEELSLIQQAQKLTDQTFSYILERIEPGRTERDIMLDMEFFMRKLGSEGVAFDFIVVSGKNTSLPHGIPTDKKVERGDFITMDFGAVIGEYRSDMTRTVAVGHVSEEQKQVYHTVLQAQFAALDAIKPGVACSVVDKIARDYIHRAGYEGCFGHGLGHSVGIEIHENPTFSPGSKSILTPGNIMTVEPGIYLENRFGVRIEDMVYVTEESCQNLTHSPKDLILL